MKVEKVKDNLVITVPINKKLLPSKAGKSLIVYSSGGNQTIPDVLFDGKPLKIGLNCYVAKE